MKRIYSILALGIISCAVSFMNATTANQAEEKCRYESLNGLKGQALRSALQQLISEHTVLDYYYVRADKAKVDISEGGLVIDMYSDCVFYTSDYCGYGDDFAECDCYNREHSLPKSYWGGSTSEPMYTDLHHIIPTDFVANTQRSAWIYDEVNSEIWTNGVSTLGYSQNFIGETAFEPADKYKGDIARIYFYMLTCYMDKNFTQGGKGWKIFNYKNGITEFTSPMLNLLLKWHRNDPVSDKERDRNEAVEAQQGNRNPFVDDPNLAEYIWAQPNKAYECSGSTIIPEDDEIPGALTCAEAREMTLAMEQGQYGNETVTVVGYVTSIISDYNESWKSQSFWLADKKGGGQVFEGYNCKMDSTLIVGDKVSITGTLYNYNGTPEIKNGTTKLLQRTGKIIEPEAIENNAAERKHIIKRIENGHLIIEIDSIKYNAVGVRL